MDLSTLTRSSKLSCLLGIKMPSTLNHLHSDLLVL